MKYQWLAPEVIQVSQMDCGPSSLKSILEGFGIPIHFGRLRELCQTDVDGTSVDTLEELASEFGLQAEQVLVPLNQFSLPEAMVAPSILITQLPNGLTHFIVVWRSWRKWVQVMDPSSGRQWITWDALKARAYRHRMQLDKSLWEGWANSEDFRLATLRRLKLLGIDGEQLPAWAQRVFVPADDELVNDMPATDNWFAIACLDAAITWAEALRDSRALNPGNELIGFCHTWFTRALAAESPWEHIIPRQYWWTIADAKDESQLKVEACVLVRIRGRGQTGEEAIGGESVNAETVDAELADAQSTDVPVLSALDPRVKEAEPNPWSVLYQLLLPAQRKWLLWLGAIVVLAAVTVTVQVLLFQGLIGMSNLLGQQQFSGFIPMVFAFIVLVALLELPVTRITQSLGRQLELQFRIALFEKIPKIHDPYFRTRLLTEMARRSHKLYQLRNLPAFGVGLVQQLALIMFTLAGLLWLDLAVGAAACLLVLGVLGFSYLWQKLLQDSVSRAHNQTGMLNMLYFDALKGLRAIRSHAAEQTFATEHEIQLNHWGMTQDDYQRRQTWALLVIDLVAFICIAGLMLKEASGANAQVPSLLWLYWLLRLPYMARHLGELILQIPNYQLVLSLFTELLQATEVQAQVTEQKQAAGTDKGVAIAMDNLSLVVAGHSVLNAISLTVNPGEHVAIVGESGAGKSSLCELLLGWKSPCSGQLLVDGQRLEGDALLALRRTTAWVDANVQIWDKSLLDNINYDHGNGRVMEAGLGPVLAHLEQGLQTPLGENGKRLSGGEGQRVRIGRALGVSKPRLVILDEPCRGLDRPAREQLLDNLRKTHAQSTLLCITHDISEAIKFPRVLVIGNGQLLEDGDPNALLLQPDSALSHLRHCEQRVLDTLLHQQQWHSLHVANGALHYKPVAASAEVRTQAEVNHG